MNNGNVTLSSVGKKPNDFGLLDIEIIVYSLKSFIEDIKIIRSDPLQSQQIIPRIIFNSTSTELPQITLKYKQDGKIIEKKLLKNNENFVFDDEPIDLEGNNFYFPFYQAKSFIYDVSPPVLQTQELKLPLGIDSSFTGTAYFENDKIIFLLKPNEKVLQNFWVFFFGFIFLLLILFLKLKHEDFASYTIIESIIGLFFIYFGSSEYLWSLGTIMFIVVIIVSLILFNIKNKPISR